MPKGIRNGTSSDFEHALSQFCGGIKERIILFSAEVGISADRVAERVSEFFSPQRDGVLDHMPAVREEAPRIRSSMEPLALAVHAHRSSAPDIIEALPIPGQKHKPSALKGYWASMTDQQRAAILRDKLLVTSKNRKLTPTEKKRLDTLTAKAKGVAAPKAKKDKTPAPAKKPTLSQAERRAKQSIYVARSLARKLGMPEPPLPSKVA